MIPEVLLIGFGTDAFTWNIGSKNLKPLGTDIHKNNSFHPVPWSLLLILSRTFHEVFLENLSFCAEISPFC